MLAQAGSGWLRLAQAGSGWLRLAQAGSGWLREECLPEYSGRAGSAIGHEGVIGDDTGFGPAEARIEPLGGASGDGIEDKQRFAGGAAGLFDLKHELGGNALAASGAEDQEFGDVGAMRLVGRGGGKDLDGSDEGGVEEGGEEDALRIFDARGGVMEEGFGFGASEVGHKADRSSAGHAIQEYGCQRRDILVGLRSAELPDFDHKLQITIWLEGCGIDFSDRLGWL
jgi:hypothetical protein